MEGGVKFIFKTLIKVPVYIYAAFLVFNIFAFCFIYFKMLGFSYLVQQTAVENNYLPKEHMDSFAEYLTDFDNSVAMVENCNIIISDKYDETKDKNSVYCLGLTRKMSASGVEYTARSVKHDALVRRQYGAEVTVGVTCNYIWIWPLDYRNTATDNINTSYSGAEVGDSTVLGGYDSSENYDNRTMNGTGNMIIDMRVNNDGSMMNETPNIVIKYTVPGLKYYPDIV